MLLREDFYHQRGVSIMAQGILPFQYEVEDKDGGMTALAGLATYLEFWYTMGMGRLIEKHVRVHGRTQGWTDEQILKSLGTVTK